MLVRPGCAEPLGCQSARCSVTAQSSFFVTLSCPQQSAGRGAELLGGDTWTEVWPLGARGVVEPRVRLRGGWGQQWQALGALCVTELGPWRGGPEGALMPPDARVLGAVVAAWLASGVP